MMNSNPHRQIIYRDSSLSSFITGIIFGAVGALMLGTNEGRQLTKKLKKNLTQLAKEIEPHLEDLPEKTSHFVNTVKTEAQNLSAGRQDLTPLPPDLRPSGQQPNITNRLHRSVSSGTTFTQGGKPL